MTILVTIGALLAIPLFYLGERLDLNPVVTGILIWVILHWTYSTL